MCECTYDNLIFNHGMCDRRCDRVKYAMAYLISLYAILISNPVEYVIL